jgi:hypothetical protein
MKTSPLERVAHFLARTDHIGRNDRVFKAFALETPILPYGHTVNISGSAFADAPAPYAFGRGVEIMGGDDNRVGGSTAVLYGQCKFGSVFSFL